MAYAIEQETPPDARVLIVVDNLGLHTPYYTNRYMMTWYPNSGVVKDSDTTPPIFHGTEEEFIQWIVRNDARITHIVWAHRDEVRSTVNSFSEFSDQKLAEFGVPPSPRLMKVLGVLPTRSGVGFRISRLP
jgi:hypothetical protein